MFSIYINESKLAAFTCEEVSVRFGDGFAISMYSVDPLRSPSLQAEWHQKDLRGSKQV